jgi:predicted MFS family arabinose efflux permease
MASATFMHEYDPALTRAQFERRSTLASAIAVATCASMIVGVFPLVLGMFADRLSLSLEQTGVLATTGQIGFGIGGALVFQLRHTQHWRRLLFVAAILATVFNGMTMWAGSLLSVIVLQLLAGVAAGSIWGLALYIVGRTLRPERAFGLMYTVGLAAYSAFAVVFPMLRESGGFPLALNACGAFLLVSGLLGWWLPDRDRPDDQPHNQLSIRLSAFVHSSLGLAALMIFELGIFAVWAYTERIGTLARISSQNIGTAIALGGLAGVAGAGTAAGIGARLGRLTPAVIATLTVLVGNALLWSPSSFPLYAAGSCLFNYGWLLALPYYMGAVVAGDRTGSLTSLLLPTQTVGAIFGPFAAALVVGSTTRPAVCVSTLACLLALVPLALVVRRLGPSSALRPHTE